MMVRTKFGGMGRRYEIAAWTGLQNVGKPMSV